MARKNRGWSLSGLHIGYYKYKHGLVNLLKV
jgi:hypothetical protein